MKSPIAIVVGTRPEAIKLVPVYLAFRRSARFDPVLISTGQHAEMLRQTFAIFDVTPNQDLKVMTPDQTLAGLTARLLTSVDDLLVALRPAGVVVQGDTTTCMAAGLAAFYRRIPVVHVEAGLRTGDKAAPFPEEINRRVSDALADLLFAPTPGAAEALAREGILDGVHVVGNTVIDSLLLVHARVRARAAEYQARFADVAPPDRKIVLVTGHRRESFGRGFDQICSALASLAETYRDAVFVYPVHLNPNVRGVVRERLGAIANIRLIDPIAYDELVYLLDRAWIVLTDSGGIQEEAPSLGKPVVVMRATTERPEGVAAGCAVLGGVETDSIVAAFRGIADDVEVFRKMSTGANPYGDGHACDAIVRITDAEL